MPEITDPGLLAQLNGGAPAPAMPRQSNPQAPPPLRQVVAPQPRVSDAVAVENLRINQAQEARAAEKYNLEQTEQADLARAQELGIADSVYQMRGVVDAAKKAKELSRDGWFATGFGAATSRDMGGTSAADVRALLNTIGSNTAFDRLQKMREESPTGGALGAVSEIELQLLRDSIASLDQSQSDVQFQENMDRVIESYQRVIDRLGGQAQEQAPAMSAGQATGSDAAPPPDAAPPGITPPRFSQGDPQLERNTSGYERQDDPALAGIRERYAQMLEESRPASEIVAYLRSAGLSDPDGLRTAAQQATFRRNNPNVPLDQYDFEQIDDRLVPMSFFQRAVNSDLAQPAVAALVGAGDTASMGYLDELANLADPEARASMEALAAENPGSTFAGQVAGGFLLPVSRAASGGRLAAEAAGYGAAYGSGSANGGLDERAVGALAGGALGAGGVAALRGAGKGIQAARNRTPGGDEAADLARMAQEEGVPVSRPVVDPRARTKMARIEAQPGGAAPVQQSMERTRQGLETGAEKLAGPGSYQEPGVMGQRIQTAAQNDLAAQRKRASDLYGRAAEQAADVAIDPMEAVAELDRQIATLVRNPNRNRATINYLQSLRRDFVDENGNLIPKSVDDIRSLRTDLSDEIKRRNLTTTNAERLTNRVIDRAGADIKRDLGDAAPDAMNTYREADLRWKLAKRDERQVVERLIGPADRPMRGDQTMNAALAWLREGGENGTLAKRFWEKLPKRDRQDFAATVADKFGKRSADEPFSPAQFITATRNIPVSSRKLLFGEEGARSIANLRALSQAYKEAAGSLNNSRSGMVSNWANFLGGLTKGGIAGTVLGTMMGGVPGGVAGGVALSGAEALIRRVNARMLMSNDMSRWLANAPKAQTPQAVTKHIELLSRVAARDPAIAQDALGLQRLLTETLGASPPRLAASDDTEE